MNAQAIAAAIAANRILSGRLGWSIRGDYPGGEERLAVDVAAYQADLNEAVQASRFAVDGIIGPVTLEEMRHDIQAASDLESSWGSHWRARLAVPGVDGVPYPAPNPSGGGGGGGGGGADLPDADLPDWSPSPSPDLPPAPRKGGRGLAIALAAVLIGAAALKS